MRTSASPAPGAAASAISIARNDCGFSSRMAFMTSESIVLRQPFAMTNVFYGRKNRLHFREQFLVNRLHGPLRPLANVPGVGAAGNGRRDILVREAELQCQLRDIHALARTMRGGAARRRFHDLWLL